jgi:hypothetical protein
MSALWGILLLAATAVPTPYRLYWGVPLDEETAVEIDEADLSVSKLDSLWALARALDSCADEHLSKPHPFGVAVREVRIDTLDGDGNVRITRRCQQTLGPWQRLLGERLFERLEDELDAHISFLRPRRQPGDPPLVDSAPKIKNDQNTKKKKKKIKEDNPL